MNKAKRIIENMEKESAFEFSSEIGDIDDNATPLKQARYINNLLNAAEKKNIGMVDTMRKCGGCCLSANAVKKAKKLYAEKKPFIPFSVFVSMFVFSSFQVIDTFKVCMGSSPSGY